MSQSSRISTVLAVALTVASCLMPFFHRAGEDYLIIGGAGFLLLFLSIVFLFQIIHKSGGVVITKTDLFFLLFGIYALLNAFVHKSVTTPILLWKWLGAVCIYILGKVLAKEKSGLHLILIVPAFVQAIVVLLQEFGWLKSFSFYFPVSGTFGNPSFPATIITLGLASLLAFLPNSFRSFVKWKKAGSLLLCVILFAGLLCCHSRTGLLALLFCFGLLVYQHRPNWKTIIVLLAIAWAALAGLYFLRPGSANLRLLIWRASFPLFAEHSLFGAGSTSFASHYMYAQASYFAAHTNSSFALIAGNHYQPYNELIRLLCEQGVVGAGMFLLAFLPLLGHRGATQIPLVALSVISITFNVSDLFILYLFFWILAGYASAGSEPFLFPIPQNRLFIPALLSLSLCFFSALRIFDRSFMHDPSHKLTIPTYEAVCEEGKMLQAEGNTERAEVCYKLAWDMIPSRITATYLLFKLYADSNDEKASELGNIILNEQPLRTVSGQTLQMKQDIRKILQEKSVHSEDNP